MITTPQTVRPREGVGGVPTDLGTCNLKTVDTSCLEKVQTVNKFALRALLWARLDGVTILTVTECW